MDEVEIVLAEQSRELPKVFSGSELIRLTEAQRTENGFSAILFTDIDNTYYRKDRQEASKDLKKMTEKNQVPVVAITGNDYQGVLKRIESGELPYFSVIAGSVGTEIWILHEKNGAMEYKKDEEFEINLLNSGFNRKELASSAALMVKNFRELHSEWDLDFQNPPLEKDYLDGKTAEVQPFKISFYAFASSAQEIEEIQNEVSSHFPNQKVVICEEVNHNEKMASDDSRKKYCIDILPVTKADVVDYFGETVKADIELVAGDSGNDKGMLTETGNVSISVGGSKPELEQALQNATQEASGRFSFRKVSRDGKTKYYYLEKGTRLGPESIIRAGEILLRAQKRFKPQLSKVSA